MKATVSLEQQKRTGQFGADRWWQRAKTVELLDNVVTVTIELTEEERAILTEYRLWETVVWDEKDYHPAMSPLFIKRQEAGLVRNVSSAEVLRILTPPLITVKELAAGNGILNFFNDSVGALNFQNMVKTTYLPKIKQVMTETHNILSTTSDTLEF